MDELELLRQLKEDLNTLTTILAQGGCAGVGGDLILSMRRKIDDRIRARQDVQP